ncbi:DUF1707 SHOCT-like domain-containing protein [Catenulispora rubra]|uniref:DUF1707 SHOCT-like domain-containing protein n=1 Tax=Catenulispora rubra TaxID=280293 RepID=UPI0018925081|nr:DUF1707 domain-containing protein [Catenulispora rubra]
MSSEPAKSPALRASDADRDRVIDTLRAAVTDGRLDPAEYDERVETALSARTFEALAPLTADLGSGPGAGSAKPATKRIVVRQKHGVVRRDGDWILPERLVVRTRWSGVELDLTQAVRTGPELTIELRVVGGGVVLVLAPDMVVDANDLAIKFGASTIIRDAGDGTPTNLRIRIVGRLKHGGVETRFNTPGAEKPPAAAAG